MEQFFIKAATTGIKVGVAVGIAIGIPVLAYKAPEIIHEVGQITHDAMEHGYHVRSSQDSGIDIGFTNHSAADIALPNTEEGGMPA